MPKIEPKIVYDTVDFANVAYYDAVFTRLLLRELVASDKFWYRLAHISSLRQVRMHVRKNGLVFEVAFLLRGSPCAWMAIMHEDSPSPEAVYSTLCDDFNDFEWERFHTQTLPICKMFYQQLCTHLLDKPVQRQ